ncbi:unnamed protein product [Effrenium voratum]|uniref:Uncharacterized protein n=1 Tax=Effrenium voratum TaxID=2562239 RepID=A0AA36ML35_9DINO|nr:unnamed protein product [Effrenium voratum]CAJ1461959.1 unnamed protein product [Effrenium voratum]
MRFHGLPFSWARGIFLALAAATGVWAKGTSNCPEGAAWLEDLNSYNKFPVNTWVPSLDFRDISFTMIADIYVYDPARSVDLLVGKSRCERKFRTIAVVPDQYSAQVWFLPQ